MFDQDDHLRLEDDRSHREDDRIRHEENRTWHEEDRKLIHGAELKVSQLEEKLESFWCFSCK